jgi:transposase
VEDLTLPSAIRLREDYSAEELRGLARRSKTVNQSRRFLSLAAVRDGMDRGSAAKIGGMDRQTLRDWVHRFNGSGPEGLVDNWTEGPKPRLSAEQLAQFAQIVEAGPDREKDGVVRWRRIDLKRVIAERFGLDFHPRYVGKLLKKLGFSTSVRGPVIRLRTSRPSRLSKKLPARAEGSSRRTVGNDAGGNLV